MDFLIHFTSEDGEMIFEKFESLKHQEGKYWINGHQATEEEFFRLYVMTTREGALGSLVFQSTPFLRRKEA